MVYMQDYISFFGVVLVLFSIFMFKSLNTFKKVLIFYTLSNLPLVFLLRDYLYTFSTVITVLLFYMIMKFIKDNYYTDTYIGLEGLVLTSPRLSLFLRVNLLMMGNFPPFLSFGMVFEHLLKSGISVVSLYIILLLILNFSIFSKLTNNLLFGRPNVNIVYRDIPLKDAFIMGFLSLVNLILGVYYLLNL